MQDAAFCIERRAVAVPARGGVEALGQFVLGFWRAFGLVLEDYYLGFVEEVVDEGKVIVCCYTLAKNSLT